MVTRRKSLRMRGANSVSAAATRADTTAAGDDAAGPCAETSKSLANIENCDVPAKLAALGCDPFAIMARIAMNPKADTKLRAAMAKELAGYLLLKPRGGDGAAGGEDAPAGAVGDIIAAAWRKPAKAKAAQAAAKPATKTGSS